MESVYIIVNLHFGSRVVISINVPD